MTPEDIVCRVFGLASDRVGDATSNDTVPEWDSMGHINLILELETTYSVSFSPDMALQMTDVGTIKRILRDQGVSW